GGNPYGRRHTNGQADKAGRAPDCPGARGVCDPIAARLLATTAEVDPQPDQACAEEHERRGLGHGAVYLTDDGSAADVEHFEEDVVVTAWIDRGQVERGIAHFQDVAQVIGLVILPDGRIKGAEGISMRARIGGTHGQQAAVRARVGAILVIVTVASRIRERGAIEGDRRALASGTGAGRCGVVRIWPVEAESVAD